MTELPALPSLGPLFVKSIVPVRHRPPTLPDRTLAVRGQRVDRAELAAYQRVCNFDVSDIVPSTFVHVLTFPLATAIMAGRDFPLPLVGLIHVENTMTQMRPVTVESALDLTVHAENLRPHRSGRQVDLVAEARVADELVWTGRSTYLHREKSQSRSAERSTPSESAAPGAGARWRVPKDIGRRYARVSGDRNPIHVNALAAKAFGFPRAIAHGMWLHARALSGITSRLPDAYTVDGQFRRPVLLPSTVAVTTAHHDDDWHIELRNERNGKLHMALAATRSAER